MNVNSKPVGPNLPLSAYTFVRIGNLTHRNLPHHLAPASQISGLKEKGVVINAGVSPETVAAAARKAVPEIKLSAATSEDGAGLATDSKASAVDHPGLSSPESLPPAPLALNNHHAHGRATKASTQESSALIRGDASVQLPPLRNPAPNNAPVALRQQREVKPPRVPMQARPAQAEPPRAAVAPAAPSPPPSSSASTKSGK
jgi:hypothetical protein